MLIVGDHMLAGSRSYLTGCRIGDEVFIAYGRTRRVRSMISSAWSWCAATRPPGQSVC